MFLTFIKLYESTFIQRLPCLLQILKAGDADEHEENKEPILSETEETKPEMEKEGSCPPQGTLNKAITNGMWNKKCEWIENDKFIWQKLKHKPTKPLINLYTPDQLSALFISNMWTKRK